MYREERSWREGSTLSIALRMCVYGRWEDGQGLSHPWKNDAQMDVHPGGWSLGPRMQMEEGPHWKYITTHIGYVLLG